MIHTDTHTKHNLTGIIPINIRQEHKMVQEVYITTHTHKEQKHLVTFNEDTQTNFRPDAKT